MALKVLFEKMDESWDPTDSNAASQVAESAIKLASIAARVLRDDSSGLRMGRDDNGELGVAIYGLFRKLGILPYNFTAKDASDLLEELCS